MAEASIPVDLFNPGQVFACLGIMETADRILGGTEGCFDWRESMTHFFISAHGSESPITVVLNFLMETKVSALVPKGSTLSTETWDLPILIAEQDAPFPLTEPDTPARLPAVLRRGNDLVMIDHWADQTNRDAVKFWAGSGGYPGAALARDIIEQIRDISESDRNNPFAVSRPQSSSFRFDWRRDYIPIDAGFSLNKHGNITPMGFPLVEIFAAIGLSHARPKREKKLRYTYGIIGRDNNIEYVSPLFMRAALGCTQLPFSQRFFRMNLGWPGKVGQARCITDVTEEKTI
jgi:CRISPR-associated protein Csb3